MVRRETEGKFGGMRKRMKQVLSWRRFVYQINKKEAREGAMEQRKKTTSKMEDGWKETKVGQNEVKGGHRNERIRGDGTAVRRIT
jgi:hypothetical protein